MIAHTCIIRAKPDSPSNGEQSSKRCNADHQKYHLPSGSHTSNCLEREKSIPIPNYRSTQRRYLDRKNGWDLLSQRSEMTQYGTISWPSHTMHSPAIEKFPFTNKSSKAISERHHWYQHNDHHKEYPILIVYMICLFISFISFLLFSFPDKIYEADGTHDDMRPKTFSFTHNFHILMEASVIYQKIWEKMTVEGWD